jgi:arabinan endo-1,5-alpha-L-arabinosidase
VPRVAVVSLAVVLVVVVAAVVAAAAARRDGPASGTATGSPSSAAELVLTGDVAAHDPSLTKVGSDLYVLSTGDASIGGGTVQIRRSSDGTTFGRIGTVWDAIPSWVRREIPKVENLWAPEVFLHDGTYYLYYSASSFGSNDSLIALATNTTLDPDAPGYRWVDQGLVWRSQPSDDYNAIDPGVVLGPGGTPYLTFGSFWSGIRQVELQWPSGKPVDPAAVPGRLVDRGSPPNAVEAASVTSHDGWYYLFASFDSCCRGLESTYKTVVGRSRSVTGPYVDESGTALLAGGGTLLLESAGREVGPGGGAVAGDLFAYHFYDGAAGGATSLAIRRIDWTDQGWPVLKAAGA